MEPAPDVSRQGGRQEEEQRIEALVAARLEQRLQHGLTKQLELDDVVSLLLRCSTGVGPVLKAAASRLGSPELFRAFLRCLEKGWTRPTPADYMAEHLCAAWLVALEEGRPQCLRLILDACSERPDVLEQLLRPTRQDHRNGGVLAEQETALTLAAGSDSPGHVECVRLLLEHGPDAQVLLQTDADGVTALMRAAAHGCTPTLGLLLAHSPGAQVAALDSAGRNALMHAASARSANRSACVRLLLAHSPEQQVQAVNRNGANALIRAAWKSDAACMRLLLAHSPAAQLAQLCPSQPAGSFHNALSAAGRVMLKGDAARGGAAAATAGGAAASHSPGRECVELLLAHGAELPDGVSAAVHDAVWSIIQKSIVDLALAVRGGGKRAIRDYRDEEGGAAAAAGGPPASKYARTDAGSGSGCGSFT